MESFYQQIEGVENSCLKNMNNTKYADICMAGEPPSNTNNVK